MILKVAAGIGAGIAIAIILLAFNGNFEPIETNQSEDFVSLSNDNEIMITNGIKHLVPLDKIRGGGPPKDGIPSVDEPNFVNVQDAHFMSDTDVVIGLEIAGDARAYPLFIMVWHEIVNDDVDNVPVSVTYCPLCYNQIFKVLLFVSFHLPCCMLIID